MWLALLALALPAFDTFDGALDPGRWYVGVPGAPSKGELRIPKGGWLVSRGLPDAGFAHLEIDLLEGRGELKISFHDERDPLGPAIGEPVRARAKDSPTVAVAAPRGTFRLEAMNGDVVVAEVRADAAAAAPRFSPLDRRTLFRTTTPERLGDARLALLSLWDVEVAVLVRRGAEAGCEVVRAPLKGAPALGVVLTCTDGRALAKKASAGALAGQDWGDERGNLGPRELEAYLASEYALLELLEQLQRAMNAALPARDGLDALPSLAAIRHSENAHAAVALAETRGAKQALAALREAAGGPKAEFAKMTGDELRAAAGRAAGAILRAPPAEWPGLRFDPAGRHAALQRARDVLR